MDRSPGADDAPRAPRRGHIRNITGRGSTGPKGLPAVAAMSVEHADGSTLDIHLPAPGVAHHAKLVAPIAAAKFPTCPICLTGEPTSREHVPQSGLGGSVMTSTCHACNNGLGSAVEAELQNWFDRALGSVRFAADGIPGVRRAPRLLHRQTPTGEFALVIDAGRPDPAIGAMLASGAVTLEFHTPDPRRYKVAALKHAYLAASLHLGRIPDSPAAQQVRLELLTARDAPPRNPTPLGPHAHRLALYRSQQPATGPGLALMRTTASPTGKTVYLLSLAGTVATSWPLPDIDPA